MGRQPDVFPRFLPLGLSRAPWAAESAGKSTGQRVQGLGLCPAPPPPVAQFRPVSPSSFLGYWAEGAWVVIPSRAGAEVKPASLFSPTACF